MNGLQMDTESVLVLGSVNLVLVCLDVDRHVAFRNSHTTYVVPIIDDMAFQLNGDLPGELVDVLCAVHR